jgi:Glucodextranase, domain B
MADPPSPNQGSPLTCAQCQAALPSDATFCLRCGARVVKPVATTPRVGRSGTLMGVAMGPLVQPPPAAPAAPQASPTPAPQPSANATSPDGSAGAPLRRVANAHATMMGVSAPGGLGANAAPPVAAPVAQPVAAPVAAPIAQARGGTIHGVAPQVASPTPAPRTGQTVQGVAQPQNLITSTGRHRREVIMTGGADAPTQSAPERVAHARQEPLATDSFDGEIPGLPKRRSGSTFGWILGGLLMIGAVVGGGWLYLHRTQGPAALAATLRTQPGGAQVVSISLPDAPGAKVRHNGIEHALDAQGRVEFPITLPADRVGYVDVPVELMRGASVEPRLMRFLVAWRAETDLAKLGDDPPKIHIVFHVMRGSSLWIAGQSIRVSGEVGIAELAGPAPSPAADGDARRERYPVRVVTPDGASIEEQYELRVPRTQLRVEDPPRVLMTHEASVVVRGIAPTASRVRIGGQAATLANGRFSAVVPVTNGSNSLDVVAYAPDGAPALVNLTVYRDVTADTYLTTGGGDRTVTALVTRPPPDGARLRVTGTVVGQVIEAPTGRTFQLVVENRACPGGRCTAWVDLPPAAQVNAGATVEVVGEIRGVRAYATQSGERRSDPVIQAVLITPRRS